MAILDALAVPIVQAPMAGGPSTPQLAAAVNRGGGLGFVAAGYLSPERLQQQLAQTRALTDRALGVNLFVGAGAPADPDDVAAYAARLAPEAQRAGVELGTPRFDDDAFAGKVEVLLQAPPAVVSCTFGVPPSDAAVALREAGCELWLTVTSVAEARAAAASGCEALIVQGVEAGGHRGVFVDDDDASTLGLLAALQLIGATVELPLVAAGALMTGAAVGAVLSAGAAAAQLGTAYLCCPEAGTSPAQRSATQADTGTVLTRAFTGRTARGIVNRLHREHAAAAPRAYPEVHHLTAPLRAHARGAGDADLVNLWAGEAHPLATGTPAEQLTRELGDEALAAVRAALDRLER